MSSDDVADVLDSAADRLEKYGWQRGAMGRKNGPCCAEGAIMHAVADVRVGDGGWQRCVSHLGQVRMRQNAEAEVRELIPGSMYLWEYNDLIAKDKRYVTRLLRRTARRLRA